MALETGLRILELNKILVVINFLSISFYFISDFCLLLELRILSCFRN